MEVVYCVWCCTSPSFSPKLELRPAFLCTRNSFPVCLPWSHFFQNLRKLLEVTAALTVLVPPPKQEWGERITERYYIWEGAGQCTLVLLLELRLRNGEAERSVKGNVLGSGLCCKQKEKLLCAMGINFDINITSAASEWNVRLTMDGTPILKSELSTSFCRNKNIVRTSQETGCICSVQ
jgi:hypothetical protein